MPEQIRLSEIINTKSERGPLDVWARQLRTAEAITARFALGTDTILLADEVGMGKTYVALTNIAEYLLQSKTNDRKVLLVTPPSSVLRVKWQQEIQSFNEHYLTAWARERKGMQAVVINSYWDLLRNLKDFSNHQVKRVHEDDRKCFTWCIYSWALKRGIMRNKNRILWPTISDLNIHSPEIVNFLSYYSMHAIWKFLDVDRSSNTHFYDEIFVSLESKRFDKHANSCADLANLFKRFASQQDAYEPNVYIIGMNALTRPRIDHSDNKFFSKYLLAHLLFGRRDETRREHIEPLIAANILPNDYADKHSHRWRLYLGSIKSLANSDFYGTRKAVIDTVQIPDIKDKWKLLSANILKGDTKGARAFFNELSNKVFSAQLERANVGMAVIDEVHNWKGGAYGSDAFQNYYARSINKKLIMSATPFQMEQNEMAKIFAYVHTPGGNSEIVIQELYAENGNIYRCLTASNSFAKTWHELSRLPVEAHRLQDLFKNEKLKKIDEISRNIADNELESKELRKFCESFIEYRLALKELQGMVGKVIIRHTKSREKRNFHIGSDFGQLHTNNHRNSLYITNGYANDADALVNFIGMRLGQITLRSEKKSYEANARLLGGLTSSTKAFLESANGLKTSPESQAYGEMFKSILDQRMHPKVTATVEQAFHNFELGRKTLIFCERVETLNEIQQALSKKIEDFIDAHGSNSAKGRLNLLKRRELLENLWWHSLWEALGQQVDGADLLKCYLPDAEVFAEQCLVKTGVYPSARRVINLLDTWLIGRAFTEGHLAQSCWTPALELITCMASQLTAELLQEDYPILRNFLAPNRGAQRRNEVTVDEGHDEDDQVVGTRDRTAIATAVDTVVRQQYLGLHNLWLVGGSSDFHLLLWQLLASEAIQLSKVNSNKIQIETAMVFYDLLDDLMTGIRKFTLRDDLLVRYERSSQADTALARLAEGMRSMQIGHDSSMLTRVTRFLTSLLTADGSISRANLAESKRKSLWQGVSIGKVGYVATLQGKTNQESRAGLCAAFNSPLLPDILICTAIGSEGIDLHRQCADVIHHDLPWNPAKLEQRNGRVDRVGSLAQMSDGLFINIGIPFLAHNYEQYQYDKVFSRAQKFEVLLGSPEFDATVTEEEDYTDENGGNIIEVNQETVEADTVLISLPSVIVEALRLDLSVKNDDTTSQ